MSKCAICTASWTTPGMNQCPICGTKVEEAKSGVPEPSAQKLPSEPPAAKPATAAGPGPRNGTAVLRPPTEAAASTPPTPPPKQPPQTPPPPVEQPTPEVPLRITVFPKSGGRGSPPSSSRTPTSVALKQSVRVPQDDPDQSSTRLKPLPPRTPATRLVDPSVVAAAAVAATKPGDLPSPARPLNGPLILGVLALVTVVMLPATIVFESSRILGILGFCMSGFFVPFAPIAWISGLSAEKRRREQGLKPESRVVLGRLLGQWGTLLLVAEITAALVLISGLRLAGKFPSSFWMPQQF